MKLFYLPVVFVVVFGSRGNVPISDADLNEQHGDPPSYARNRYNYGYSSNGGNNFYPYDARVKVHNSGHIYSPYGGHSYSSYGGQGNGQYGRESSFGHRFGHLGKYNVLNSCDHELSQCTYCFRSLPFF